MPKICSSLLYIYNSKYPFSRENHYTVFSSEKMGELFKSSVFFSDQHLCHADILPPSEVISILCNSRLDVWFNFQIFFEFLLCVQVRARIEVAVINFLKNLNSTTPEISDLPLVRMFFLKIQLQYVWPWLEVTFKRNK